MDLCLAAKERPGTKASKRQCEQECLELEGMQTADQSEELEERGGG